ncbi:MAG TPA: hypothetical protein VEC76_09165 [Streptosporangiaceae bacterium]|nr:hypothetical protein [Streptosporangiaceae bacterium]
MHSAIARELVKERVADLHRQASHDRTVQAARRAQRGHEAHHKHRLPGGLTTATLTARRILAILASRQPASEASGRSGS